MSETVIQVENLSKQYRLGVWGTGTLSHDLKRWWYLLRGREDPYLKIGEVNDRTVAGESDYVWSLKNINFEVKQGETLGIIGRNGAGKSTLLKILSKVTCPTDGQVKLKGRIASLLEVGTGFHPELTGRENVFMNGAILGMTKREIRHKFDEIVDFSGVERYIDTPVKRYSSGMYVRLAFAVAAHLESEILIVDEVLAVGDAEFQNKCLDKMRKVSQVDGRTVLFVSHNLRSLRSFCENGILLINGQLCYKGNISDTIENYFGNNALTRNEKEELIKGLPDNEYFQLIDFDIYQSDRNNSLSNFNTKQSTFVKLKYKVKKKVTGLRVYFDVTDEHDDILIRSFHDEKSEGVVPPIEPGKYQSVAEIPSNLLAPKKFYLYVRATIFNVGSCTGDGIKIPLKFELDSLYHSYFQDTIYSKLLPDIRWENKSIME